MDNKILLDLNQDGSHVDEDYAPIFAKVYYMGWKDTQVTYPIEVGTEGILLFADREIESWYLNGGVNTLNDTRMHELTDAIFIAGLHSMPNIAEFVQSCLYMAYKTSNIKLQEKNIIETCDEKIELTSGNSLVINNKKTTINSDTSLTLTTTDTNVTSKITITGDVVATGNIAITGNVSITGNLTVSGDATIGGISFLNHTHPGVLSGGASTGTPQ